MSRKTTATLDTTCTTALTTVPEKPTRHHKTPRERAETLTARIITALRALAKVGAKLRKDQQEASEAAIQADWDDMLATWRGETDDEPETFHLPE